MGWAKNGRSSKYKPKASGSKKRFTHGQRNAYSSGMGYSIAYNGKKINFSSSENKAAFAAGFKAGSEKIKSNPKKYSSLFKK